MSSLSPVIVFGGTFDPIHFGHLRLAENLHNLMPNAEIRMIPSARPPLKDVPQTTAEQRLTMLQQAIGDCPHLIADDRELSRSGMSYTLLSIEELVTEKPEQPVVLVLGADAYSKFSQWYGWQQIVQMAVLLVVSRPINESTQTRDIEQEHLDLQISRCGSIEELLKARRQAVYYYDAPMLDISATQIRRLVANMQSPRFLLPQSVIQYINQHDLYVNPSTLQSKVTE